ncbi:RING-H2 finger protein ATL65-like [Papaver somniferum]|uniref:RING-H2 finger protein ATL65-like n=1 Tax=Papaver somniferum TaxID=3469 RepID=UPI000E700B2A|nr:RING-H2 finger protein ATL65-like [Papaver somniferum]
MTRVTKIELLMQNRKRSPTPSKTYNPFSFIPFSSTAPYGYAFCKSDNRLYHYHNFLEAVEDDDYCLLADDEEELIIIWAYEYSKTPRRVKPPPPPANDEFKWGPTPAMLFNQSPSSRIPVDFSPPLIAMVVIVITAFVIVTYFRLISRHLLPPIIHLLRKWRIRWRLYRHRRRSYNPDIESSFSPPSDSAFHYLSSYGLDDSLIKTIPLSIYSAKTKTKSILDCAVCLLEFEENDYIRTLPICSHSFHVDCIDIWLRSHANCPLCRGGIFPPQQLNSSSPFIPLMASRIRPRIEDIDILESILSESRNYENSNSSVCEIRNDSFDHHCHRDSATSPGRIINEIDFNSNNNNNRNFLLKRSYSFGFERNLLPSSDNRLLSETATTSSPWRRSFWSKRTTSPFSCTTVSSKSRVFSLRYYRGGIKSPFFRRSRGSSSFFPLSESNFQYGGGGGGYSSRRSKSMTSPFFMRSSAAQPSSRLRCGDPEALLSPERLSRR